MATLTIRAYAIPYLIERLRDERYPLTAWGFVRLYEESDKSMEMVTTDVGPKVKELCKSDSFLFVWSTVEEDTDGEDA